MITSVVSFDLKRCSFGADKGLFLDQIFGEFPLPFTNNDFMDLHMRQNLLSLIVMFPFFFLLSFPFTSSVVICPVFLLFFCALACFIVLVVFLSLFPLPFVVRFLLFLLFIVLSLLYCFSSFLVFYGI